MGRPKKIQVKHISESHLKSIMGDERYAELRHSEALDKQAGTRAFGSHYATIPIPFNVVKSRISKENQTVIESLIAMRCNEMMREYALAVKYVHEHDKSDPAVQQIMARVNGIVNNPSKDAKILDELDKHTAKVTTADLIQMQYFK